MITELVDVGCRGEVAGKESYSGWDTATELPSSRGYVDKVLSLH